MRKLKNLHSNTLSYVVNIAVPMSLCVQAYDKAEKTQVAVKMFKDNIHNKKYVSLHLS